MDKIIYNVPLYNRWGEKIKTLTDRGYFTKANFMLAVNQYEQEYVQNGCLPAPFEFVVETYPDLMEISDYVAFSKEDLASDVQFPCRLRITTTTSYLGWFPVVNAPSVNLVWNEIIDGESVSRAVHGKMLEAKGFSSTSKAYADGIELGNFSTKKDTIKTLTDKLLHERAIAAENEVSVEPNTPLSVDVTYYNQITNRTDTVVVEWDNLIPW